MAANELGNILRSMRIFESKLNNVQILALMDEGFNIHALEMSGMALKPENFTSYDLMRIKQSITRERIAGNEPENERVEFASRFALDLLKKGMSSSAAIKKALQEAGLTKKHDKLVRNSEPYRKVMDEQKTQCKKFYK